MPLRVGIWLAGPSEERISRVAGGNGAAAAALGPVLDLEDLPNRKAMLVVQDHGAPRGAGYGECDATWVVVMRAGHQVAMRVERGVESWGGGRGCGAVDKVEAGPSGMQQEAEACWSRHTMRRRPQQTTSASHSARV